MAIKKYAMVVEGDVFGLLTLEDDGNINPNGPRLAAGLSSDPKIVVVPDDSPVTHGWTWDGTNFYEPVEE